MNNQVKKKIEFLNFKVQRPNGTLYNKRETLSLFNGLKNEDKENLKDHSEDDIDFSFLTIYKLDTNHIYGMLINQDAENKFEINPKDRIPTRVTDITVANITFFCIFCIGQDNTGMDRFVFSYMKNEHGPAYTKLIEILNQRLSSDTIIFDTLTDKEVLNRIKDDSPVYQLCLSFQGPIDKYLTDFKDSDLSFDKTLSGFGAKTANVDISGGDLRKKDKTPIIKIIGKHIKQIFQKYSEDTEFKQNLDSFIVKLSTKLGKIETIDFIKNRIEEIIYINRVTDTQTPQDYIDYIFEEIIGAFNKNEERIKKDYLFE